jgi:PAS domain S-box-containing protein
VAITVADAPGAILNDVSFGDRRLLLVLQPGATYAARLATDPLPIALTAAAAAAAVALYAVQRRRFEGALRKAAARLRSVLAASPDAFIGLDDRGRIVDWSDQAAGLFGLPRNEALNRRVASLLAVPRAGADIDRAASGMERVLAGLPSRGESLALELVGLRSDGTRLPVEVTMAVSPTATQWSVACFVRDVTDRRQAREELLRARAREAIGDLTGRLAHDFNNLLGIIVGTLDLARDDLGDRPDALELLDMAIDAGVRGTDITKALLAVARRQALAPADVDVNEAVRDVAPLLRQAAGSEIDVILDLAPGPVLAHLDPGGLTNSVLNLVINGAHAMPSGGAIRVSSRSENGACTITVTDTGTGMSPEVLARVFEPFFTTRPGGTGLGLAIVHGFAAQSGGSVAIESAVGIGTTVTLHLPGARGSVPAPAPAAPPRTLTGTERVVVVDDEGGLRDIASAWLRAAGYQVHTASSGPEGLEIVRAVRPRLLLTDVIMPGAYGGFELAQRARAEIPDLRIVLVSGYAGRDLDGVIDSGLHLLEKPYRRRDVIEAVRAALDAPGAVGLLEPRHPDGDAPLVSGGAARA